MNLRISPTTRVARPSAKCSVAAKYAATGFVGSSAMSSKAKSARWGGREAIQFPGRSEIQCSAIGLATIKIVQNVDGSQDKGD
jgi:hypothetical protein